MDLLVRNAGQVVTLGGWSDRPQTGSQFGELRIVPDGFVAVKGDQILAVGPMEACPDPPPGARVIDAHGRAVLPGFVDPHTHIFYGGNRAHEFALRIRGASYLEIAQAGGGILSTVEATRAASEEELAASALTRLDRMLLAGTTTAETKSGYGLTLADELKTLRAIQAVDRSHPIDLVATFMGAHEIPKEYKGDPEAYVRLVIDEMLPQVGALAAFNDVFCEEGVFTVEQARRILAAGKRYGLAPRIHADELVPGFGGAELAAEVGAVTADHLLYTSDHGLQRLREAGTIAVCLPGTPFFLMMQQYAPARRMVELGVPVALATDCNPGSCPIESMGVIMGLACLQLRLSPAQALAGATINAAHAIGRAHEVGSLEPGKLADLLILSEPSYESIPYRFGSNLVRTVIKRGRVVVEEGALTAAGERGC